MTGQDIPGWITAIATAGTALALLVPMLTRMLGRYQLLPFRGGRRPPLMLLKDAALIISEKNPRRTEFHSQAPDGTPNKDDPKLGIVYDIFRYAEQGGIALYGKRRASRIPVRIGSENLRRQDFKDFDHIEASDGNNWYDLSISRFDIRKISKWIDLGAH